MRVRPFAVDRASSFFFPYDLPAAATARSLFRYAACVAPLAQGFVPARTAAARTAVVVRSEPIEINAPTVYSHWSANVNEEVVFPASLKNVLAAEDDIVTLPKGETSRKIPRAAA